MTMPVRPPPGALREAIEMLREVGGGMVVGLTDRNDVFVCLPRGLDGDCVSLTMPAASARVMRDALDRALAEHAKRAAS